MKLIVRVLILLVKAIVVMLLLASAAAFIELVVEALDASQWLEMQGR